MIRSLPALSAASLLLLMAACAPYKPAGAPCGFADRSACGEVAPINQDGPPATGGVRNASASGTFDLQHVIAAADAAEAAREVPQGSTSVETDVIIIGDDDDDLTIEEADAELDRELAIRKAIEKERTAAALREASLKGDLRELRQELAAAKQSNPVVSSGQRAVPKVAVSTTTNQAHNEIMTKQKPGLRPATLRDANTAVDGPESGERSALVAGGPVDETALKTDPGVQLASSGVRDPEPDKQARRVRTVKSVLASLTPDSASGTAGDSVVDQELSKYRDFKHYQVALKTVEASRQIRNTYVELAVKEDENGPYTKLLARLEPLPTDAELRARYGVPTNWVPE